jgi:DNA-binding HxlR family transcriptional regulator
MEKEIAFKVINNFAFGIMKDMKKEPKRFTDFYNSCPNETTRSKKLKKLEQLHLIVQKSIGTGDKKVHPYYLLTDKGKKVLEILEELKSIWDSC